MVARPWSSSRLSCVERLLLRCDRNVENSLPSAQGKDPSSRARKRKRGSSGCGRDSRASSRVETGMSGNFLSCSKGVKDLWKLQRLGVISLETPQRNGPHLAWRGEPPGCSRVSAGALDLRRGLRDPLSWPQERPVPMPVAQGPLGIPLPSMPGLRYCVEPVPEPEDSSPVLTWIFRYFWSLPNGVSPRLERGHAHELSSRAVAAAYASLRVDQGIRGFPMRLSHRAVPRATVV